MTRTPGPHALAATYDSPDKAEAAIRSLHAAGLAPETLSIVGGGFLSGEPPFGLYAAGDRTEFWGSNGAFWGELWGLLAGGALFVIPEIGPLAVMGPLVAALVGVVEGSGGGVGSLAAALASLGLPDRHTSNDEADVEAGLYLVIVNGTPDKVSLGCVTLRTTPFYRMDTHVEGLHRGPPALNPGENFELALHR